MSRMSGFSECFSGNKLLYLRASRKADIFGDTTYLSSFFFFYLLFIFGIYMYKVTGNNNKSQILDECIEETVYKTHK